MNKFETWYSGLSATQRVLLSASIAFGVAALSAFAHQKIGERRGYRRGLADGMSPLKQAELDKAEAKGYNDGWYDGAWANNPETMAAGIRHGSEMAMEASRNALLVVNQARYGLPTSTQTPALSEA